MNNNVLKTTIMHTLLEKWSLLTASIPVSIEADLLF